MEKYGRKYQSTSQTAFMEKNNKVEWERASEFPFSSSGEHVNGRNKKAIMNLSLFGALQRRAPGWAGEFINTFQAVQSVANQWGLNPAPQANPALENYFFYLCVEGCLDASRTSVG